MIEGIINGTIASGVSDTGATLQTKNPDIFPVYSKRLEYTGNMSQLANSTLEFG